MTYLEKSVVELGAGGQTGANSGAGGNSLAVLVERVAWTGKDKGRAGGERRAKRNRARKSRVSPAVRLVACGAAQSAARGSTLCRSPAQSMCAALHPSGAN